MRSGLRTYAGETDLFVLIRLCGADKSLGADSYYKTHADVASMYVICF